MKALGTLLPDSLADNPINDAIASITTSELPGSTITTASGGAAPAVKVETGARADWIGRARPGFGVRSNPLTVVMGLAHGR